MTRSKTGIRNVLELMHMRQVSLSRVELTYVTRCYVTRHGAGPLPNEIERPFNIIDRTNTYNEYQGRVRFSWLNVNELAARIERDLVQISNLLDFGVSLFVTCLDQVGSGTFTYVKDNKLVCDSERNFIKDLREATGVEDILVSRGPTRDHVSVYDF